MEAAGLASSIITFIEFSCKLINGTVVVYKKAATGPAADPHISNVINDLEDATKAMRTTSTASSGQAAPHQRELLALSNDCNELSRELIAILKDLERKTDGSKLWRSLQASWKTLRKSDRITEIEQKLNTYRLQILLRVSLMLSDDEASVKAQLDQMHRGNVESFGRTIVELQTVQEAMKELDTRLRLLANQARHASVMDTEQADALIDIRGELSRITQALETIPRRAPADLHIIARLRFEMAYARVDAIVDGEFDIFTKLLRNNQAVSEHEGVAMTHDSAEMAQKHAQNALVCWLKPGNNILHISGKAGSGKSTLMKLLSQDKNMNEKLRAWTGNTKLVIASFFFWIAGDALQNSLEGLYRSILLEILQQCPELTRSVFPKLWNEISTCEGLVAPEPVSFRLFELQDAMTRLVQGLSDGANYRFCFFVDGLDEFAGESMDHLKLAKQLRQWAESSYVKICASSRPHEEFHSVFNNCTRIHLHELTGPDIFRFSQETLKSEDNCHLTSHEVVMLAYGIQDRAEGVFLWAHLVVHSLCRGILHLDSYGNLQAKLDRTPGDLMKLFLHLFQQISPADRTRAYQMLLIVTDDDIFWNGGNAIMVSWLDDLQDADFPYNIPRVAYTDEEVARRIKYAERQLKLACHGLLEMGPSHEIGFWREPSADVYFQHSVRFFHRTARDFLDEPETASAMHKYLGERTITSSDILRLRLAEIKFARTYRAALKTWDDDSHQLRKRFLHLCGLANRSPRVLGECERILQQYREEPYSIPDKPGRYDRFRRETNHNDGLVFWGEGWSLEPTWQARSSDSACLDISWIHLLAHIDAASDLVMDRVTSGSFRNSSWDLCLVLSASLGPFRNSDTLERLLGHGMQLSDREKIHDMKDLHDDVQYVPGWVAFLVVLGNESGSLYDQPKRLKSLYASLESFLLRRRGLDVDVNIEYHRRQDGRFTTGQVSWAESGPGCGPVKMALEEVILHSRPPNMDSLLREIQARKSWRGWAGNLASWTLRGASTWIPTSNEAVSSRYVTSPLNTERADFTRRARYKRGYDFAVRRIWVGDQMYEMGPNPWVRIY